MDKSCQKGKKRRTLSIFSSRTYTVYKYSLASERFTNAIVEFYNIIISECHYLNRWLDILEVLIEKGHGPTLGKLRTI